ncbi:MAG: T9SS type A sorting domain-containing protein, partial [Chitinophagaceae bacterium]
GELVAPPVTNISVEQKLVVDVMPNPSNTYFDLVINSSNKSPVSVKIFDISGQVVERRERISSISTLRIGKKLTSGSYFVEVVQDDQRKFIKIIKVN